MERVRTRQPSVGTQVVRCPGEGCSNPAPMLELEDGTLVPKYCPQCGDRRRAENLQNNMANKIAAVMERRGVAPRFLKARLLDFPDNLRELVAERSAFLTGPRGVGKTHLMAALARQRTARGDTNWRFVNVADLLLEIKATFDGSGSEQAVLNKYANAGALYLDDLGVEKMTDWVALVLYMILDRRYSNNRPTVITTNLSLSEIKEKHGDRIASRLSGMCDSIVMTGRDRRLK